MKETYITIVGVQEYQGSEIFRPKQQLKLVKDRTNSYDDEAIAVFSDMDVKYGNVANSVRTVARGTHSAGYIYETFAEETGCEVCFIVGDRVIARLTEPSEQ